MFYVQGFHVKLFLWQANDWDLRKHVELCSLMLLKFSVDTSQKHSFWKTSRDWLFMIRGERSKQSLIPLTRLAI